MSAQKIIQPQEYTLEFEVEDTTWSKVTRRVRLINLEAVIRTSRRCYETDTRLYPYYWKCLIVT